MKSRNFIFGLLAMAFASAAFTACTDKDEEIIEVDRIFRPVVLDPALVNKNGVSLKWNEIYEPVAYAIEFSTDSFKTIYSTDTVAGTAHTFLKTGLSFETRYMSRIMALAANSDKNSHYAVFKNITTEAAEVVILPVATADITETSAVLRWRSGFVVSKLVLTNLTDDTTIEHELTAAEVAANAATITGLTAGTNYRAGIFIGEMMLNSQVFTTLRAVIPPSEAINLYRGDDLTEALDAAPNGATLVLEAGVIFTLPKTYVFGDKAVHFLGASLVNRPIIAFDGSTTVSTSTAMFTLPASAEYVRFENVEISGLINDEGTAKMGYIVNQNKVTDIAELSFNNCVLRHTAQGAIRLQGTANFENLIINNCQVKDIGDNGSNGTYSVIQSTVASAKFMNITVTNSTFDTAVKGLLDYQQNPVALKVEGNTFYNSLGTNRQLMDLGANQVNPTVSIKHNIFAKSYNEMGAGLFRTNAASTVSAENNHTTADMKLDDTKSNSNHLLNLTPYAGTSFDLFVEPATGNYTIKDAAFVGKSTAGDPRWRN